MARSKNPTPTDDDEDPKNTKTALLTVYTEICKSYQAVDDFRTKLLGFLPLTSLVGIFILSPDSTPSAQDILSNELLGFAAIFAALLTLALFGYEVRGIRRSDDLIKAGRKIEQKLGIYGQFHVCREEYRGTPDLSGIQRPSEREKLSGTRKWIRVVNSKSLACIIYSVVFAAWLFLALRLGWGLTTFTCYTYAIIAGLALASIVYVLVADLIPA